MIRLLAALLLLWVGAAHAAPEFPTRVVRLVVAFPPGGTNDVIARLLAASLADVWGQPVIVDNRAGAGGTIGTDLVARARAEGLDIAEPVGADALLAQGGNHVYLAMYHDQAHIPIKLLGIGASSGMPIGTPVLFSSVPHGSAFDIVGKNQANPGAIINTLKRLAAVSQT